MELKAIDRAFTICKLRDVSAVQFGSEFCFLSKTDEELSLVCETADVPTNTMERDDGWKAFRIQGVLDLSLVGILAAISSLLAEHNIGLFAVSTFNTDYIFTKKENFAKAIRVLAEAGYGTEGNAE